MRLIVRNLRILLLLACALAGVTRPKTGARARSAVRFGVWAAAAALAVTSCGGEGDGGGAAEEERARAAAEEVAKNCHNPAAPNETCASVEELSRLSPGRWRTRIRLFNGRDVCVTIELGLFERVGDDLRGVDRIAC